MRKEIYLDNSATTKPYPEVVETVVQSLNEYYNPSAIYAPAISVSKKIETVRKNLLRSLSAEKGTILFTSGGTESINLAIRSETRLSKKIITTDYEHDATIKTVENLERNGYFVDRIKPQDGAIREQTILEAVDEKTSLVSVMHVNNETGHIIDIQKLCKEIKKKNPQTNIHIDAVQSFMKYPLDVERSAIDFLSISSHKIHGIKGTGALYVRNPEKLKPLIFGGGQENGLRSGTENVSGILALGAALEIGQRDFFKNAQHLEKLREYFLQKVQEIPSIHINSPKDGAKHILNISFLGVPSEIMLHSLEEKGIYVSSGSACSAKKKGSHVLESLGLKDDVKKSAIRFSFSHQNTVEEVDHTIAAIREIVQDIRKITKYKG